MLENFEEIKNKVLILGDLEETEKLNLEIETIINEVLAYLYREDVPETMVLPLANVIVGELNKNVMSKNVDISSYSEGDMSISFDIQEGVKYGGKLDGFKLIRGLKNV